MNTLLSSTTSGTAPPPESGSTKQKKGGYLPPVFQSLLMSATLTADVTVLKSLVLRNPAILTLTEEDDEESKSLLSQYVLHVPTEVDKFLYIYVILKLKLIKGKAILFVNDVERCYRLKLFLEQFSIRACVLNRELPINSRWVHIFRACSSQG
jgi:ATP-dependent RNA helicase DDX56/DBP9